MSNSIEIKQTMGGYCDKCEASFADDEPCDCGNPHLDEVDTKPIIKRDQPSKYRNATKVHPLEDWFMDTLDGCIEDYWFSMENCDDTFKEIGKILTKITMNFKSRTGLNATPRNLDKFIADGELEITEDGIRFRTRSLI